MEKFGPIRAQNVQSLETLSLESGLSLGGCIHLAKKSCKSSKNRILWVDLEKFLNFPRYILTEIQFLRGRANRADIRIFRAIRAEAKNASGRVGSGWPFFGPYGPRAGRADGLWPDPPLEDSRF